MSATQTYMPSAANTYLRGLNRALKAPSIRIALESVYVGMGLSLVAMIAAAAGYIPPVAGAVLQEGIDVLVILNALRALGGGGLVAPHKVANQSLARELACAHRTLRPQVAELAALAARLDTLSPCDARTQLESARDMLDNQLLPHEREEQRSAYPVLGQMLQHEDPSGPLIQTHHEIHRLARLYSRLVAQLPPKGRDPRIFGICDERSMVCTPSCRFTLRKRRNSIA
jgi:Hemerythrin HHE cation binding domain